MLIPDEKIIRLIRLLPKTQVANKLMVLPDRDIALSMRDMDNANRDLIFSFLSPSKIQRIKSEIELHKRLKIKYSQYKKAVQQVIDILATNQQLDSKVSYLRPKRDGK